LNEYFKEFDSILRFFNSQITAHSNYIVATGFAFAVYLYRLLDRLLYGLTGNAFPFLYDIMLFIILIIFFWFGLFLLGRLFYYVELSGVIHNWLGFSEVSETYYQSYKKLFEKELQSGSGLNTIVIKSFRRRIMYCLLKRIEEKKKGVEETEKERMRARNFEELCRIWPMSERRAFLITFANWLYDPNYRIFRSYFKAKIGF